MKIFVDTNILLDVFLERKPHCDYSIKIWDIAENRMAQAFVSAISFNNIYYILNKYQGRECARRSLEVLNANFSIVPLDKGIMEKAISSPMSDFEDAIQLFSALSSRADCIVTRDCKDFPQDSIPILSPQTFLAQFNL